MKYGKKFTYQVKGRSHTDKSNKIYSILGVLLLMKIILCRSMNACPLVYKTNGSFLGLFSTIDSP